MDQQIIDVDISSSLNSVLSLLKQIFDWVFAQLGAIRIGSVSLLGILIGFTVFSILFTATLTVVRSSSVGAIVPISTRNANAEARQRNKEANERNADANLRDYHANLRLLGYYRMWKK